jgi:hypothetical protein
MYRQSSDGGLNSTSCDSHPMLTWQHRLRGLALALHLIEKGRLLRLRLTYATSVGHTPFPVEPHLE